MGRAAIRRLTVLKVALERGNGSTRAADPPRDWCPILTLLMQIPRNHLLHARSHLQRCLDTHKHAVHVHVVCRKAHPHICRLTHTRFGRRQTNSVFVYSLNMLLVNTIQQMRYLAICRFHLTPEQIQTVNVASAKCLAAGEPLFSETALVNCSLAVAAKEGSLSHPHIWTEPQSGSTAISQRCCHSKQKKRVSFLTLNRPSALGFDSASHERKHRCMPCNLSF